VASDRNGAGEYAVAGSHFKAVLFDLLTALVDSWSLWIDVAGDEETGRSWRTVSLRLVTGCGDYRPYEDLVMEATAEIGLPPEKGREILDRWGELRPWPEVAGLVPALAGWRMGVVTNCSQACAERAAAATGLPFEAIVSAERAGVYKTDPRAYRAGLEALGLDAADVLFVAGSPHDVPGAAAVGMAVYWSNRLGQPLPPGAPPPLVDARDLRQLPAVLRATG
jgi:2-haloalkanoic acid dehalogenase type II